MMFFSAALAHLLAVMSPGPDTAIIFHQSLVKGRAQGIFTALGIGFGIFIHCLFAISDLSGEASVQGHFLDTVGLIVWQVSVNFSGDFSVTNLDFDWFSALIGPYLR